MQRQQVSGWVSGSCAIVILLQNNELVMNEGSSEAASNSLECKETPISFQLAYSYYKVVEFCLPRQYLVRQLSQSIVDLWLSYDSLFRLVLIVDFPRL
jgi:hypothetical protein